MQFLAARLSVHAVLYVCPENILLNGYSRLIPENKVQSQILLVEVRFL